MTALIQLSSVNKRYASGQHALANVSFELGQGEMAFLTGHSGAGKSTLLELIALLEQPTSGEVLFNGANLNRVNHKQAPFYRRQIGLIFQDPYLLDDRSVFDNVSLPLIIANYRYSEIKNRVQGALSKVGLSHKANTSPQTLSAGEQQRVSIARALVNKPPLILADEPTGNLDPDLAQEIMHLFEQFNDIGVTLLIATHDLQLINQLHQRRLHLDQGRLVNDESGYHV